MKKIIGALLLIFMLPINSGVSASEDRVEHPYKNIFEHRIEENKGLSLPVFVSHEVIDDELVVIVMFSVESGMMAKFKDNDINFLAEVTFSTKSKTPLVETDGGIATSKTAYSLYREISNKPFELWLNYSYQKISELE